MTQFPTHLYFENSAEEVHLHETLSTPMKLSSSLSLSIQCHISIFNAHENPIETGLTRHLWEKKKKYSPCKDLPVVFVIDNRMSHTTNHRCMEKQRSSSSLQLEANTLSTKKHCSSSTARQTAYQTRYAVETLNKQSLHRRWWWDLTPQESRASPTHPTRKRTKRR
jgi:hypothetical protein